jgi:hypothetical protein
VSTKGMTPFSSSHLPLRLLMRQIFEGGTLTFEITISKETLI